MKSYLLLLLLLLSISCMKTSEESKQAGLSGDSLSMEQVKAVEIDSINKRMNDDPQYKLTKSEYETLLKSGLLSESEKMELGMLFQ